VDGYARRPPGVLAELRYVRRLLTRGGASKEPIWLTEFGWSTGAQRTAFTVSLKEQAKLIGELIRTLAHDRCQLRLKAIFYYAWRDGPSLPAGHDYWTRHTGLLEASGQPKPSLAAFRRAAAAALHTRCR